MNVSDIMTRNVVYITPNAFLWEAIQTMNSLGIRHLLVVEGSVLCGVLSVNDIPASIKNYQKVVDFMTFNPITVQETDTVDYAKNTLYGALIGSLPVLRGNKLVGIITKQNFS